MRTLIIIPTYNEKDNVPVLIKLLGNYDSDILFVDDSSPDGTSQVIDEIMKTDSKINILKRNNKMGLGSAYVGGFEYALRNNYDKIIMMDGDLSHPADKIPELINSEADFVTGSRYVQKGKIENWPWYRYLLSKCANIYASAVLNIGVKDLTSGFNCIRTDVIKKIEHNKLKGEGYAFLIELKYRAWKNGFTLKELPITFRERIKGKSKISKNVIWEAFWLVLRLKLF